MSIKKIVLLLVGLLILAAGGFIYMDIAEQERLIEAKRAADKQAMDRQLAAEQAILARTKCNQFGDYFVITLDREGGVGQDILVRENSSNAEQECRFAPIDSDFSLVNAEPQFFKALESKALVTDIGTGPSGRSLRIYDLTEKSLITEKKYFEDLKVASGTLTYLGLAKQKADKKNCKEYDSLMKDFSNANLIVEKNVDLKTYLVKEGKTTKCVAEK